MCHKEMRQVKARGSKSIDRVMLVYPPMVFPKLQSRQTVMFPMGIGYIAAVLEEEFDVSILDAALQGYDHVVDVGNGRVAYGLSDSQLVEAIGRFNPQLVGVSCLFSSLHNQVLRVAKCAKQVDSEIVTVVGGPHASALPGRVLADGNVDFCVIGEGEGTMLELVRGLSSGRDVSSIAGLAFRDSGSGRVVITQKRTPMENLDDLPRPARHLVDMERYFGIGKLQGLRLDGAQSKPLRIVQVATSRGCPHNCTFCGVRATWGRSFRMRSAENVLDEIEQLIETYGAERIAFQDDNLTVHRKRAAAIFDGMVDRGLNVTWEAHNGLQASTLNDELLEKMKRSGCVSFTVGIESGTPEILRRVKKPVNLKTLPRTIRKAQDLGMDVRGFFIIGFPGETLQQVQRTCKLARSLQLSVTAFAILTPLPGSQLYEECVEDGLIDEDQLVFESLSFGGMGLQLSEVPVEELMRIRKIEWLLNVFADDQGNLKRSVPVSPEEMLGELENGLALYPDSEEVRKLYDQARSLSQT